VSEQSGGRPDPAERRLGWTAVVVLLAMLAATTILSQFFRYSMSVIGPELIRDLSLSSQELGIANASFFLALLLAQIPVGIAFDRFGPRRTVAALSVPLTIGAMLHGLVDTGLGLALARFMVGIGCAGSFTAGVVLISRWFARQSWSMVLSWHFALGQLGLVLAGLPLAWATEAIGWRFSLVVMGVAAILVGYLFLVLVRDVPPGAPPGPSAPADPIGAWEGLRRVITMPGLVQVLCLFMVGYAALVTVQSLWAGPYLHDVFGLDAMDRGKVLLGMAVVQTLGVLVIGPMDRLLNTRKWVAAGSASLALTALVALAAVPMTLQSAVFFLLLLSASSAYGGVLFAQIRSLFPDHLAGRSATVSNMAPMLGAALLPTLTGFIPPLFPSEGSGYAPAAYQCIFATLAVFLAIGLAIYLTAKDAKPRPVPQASAST